MHSFVPPMLSPDASTCSPEACFGSLLLQVPLQDILRLYADEACDVSASLLCPD